MKTESKTSRMVSFKVDPTLVEAMEGIPNRSEFIRSAILAALESACPLCLGTGVLNPKQREHWDEFVQNHTVVTCGDCQQRRLVCAIEEHS